MKSCVYQVLPTNLLNCDDKHFQITPSSFCLKFLIKQMYRCYKIETDIVPFHFITRDNNFI